MVIIVMASFCDRVVNVRVETAGSLTSAATRWRPARSRSQPESFLTAARPETHQEEFVSSSPRTRTPVDVQSASQGALH